MRVLVVGVGVIGSYLAHALCTAGNDVTVLARGSWAQTLRSQGLRIHHRFQRRTTTDHPVVVEELPAGAHYDAAFSAMRQDQQVAALPLLAAVDADVLVFVGNDTRAPELASALESTGRAGRVLLGFQSTAGVREGDHVECVRWGAVGMDVGPLRGEPTRRDRELLGHVLAGSYKPHWTHDMGDWLLCHAAAVLPMCFVSYACGCDLHRATRTQLHDMMSAMIEGYRLLVRLGHQILPEGDRKVLDGGPTLALWTALEWAVMHSAVGTLCVDDHCRHAPDELRSLDDGLARLRAQAPDLPMPAWDRLRAQMGGWGQVVARWGAGAARP